MMSNRMFRSWACGGILFALSLLAPRSQAQGVPPETDAYAAILRQQAIEPRLESITGYLKGLSPTAENKKHLTALFMQLGGDDFARRELAMRQLIAMPVIGANDLATAIDSDESEIHLRAQQVAAARTNGNASSSVAVACFRTISRRKIAGASATVLEVLPLYQEEFVLSAAREALKVTSRVEDIPMLRAASQNGSIETRVAAIGALAAIAGDDARPNLATLVAEDSPRIKLAAARALADRGDRACLPPLVQLLSAPDARVRHASISTLRALTGRSSDYAAWLEPKSQATAIAQWEKWLTADASSATLNHPLRPADLEMGRTLICLYGKNEVVELDSAGHQTFAISEPGGCPWACQGLATGGRLVAMYSENLIVEYRPDGKERVRIPVPGGPMSVQRLDNGNTLVACNNGQKVVEVEDSGKVVWEVEMSGGPCDAARLDNGHTLVTLQNNNTVVEIDSAGKEIWKIEELHTPRSAMRLENGNTLICDLGSGKVIEYDPSGNEAWSQSNLTSPFGAQRLSDGTTVISDTQSIKEIDRGGKLVNEKEMASMGRVHRY